MNPTTVGVVVFVVMCVMIFLRCPVYLAMLVCGLAGMLCIVTPSMTISQFTSAPFTTPGNYTYAVIPMFTFLGILTEKTGIAEGTFTAASKWLGRSRGGLLKTVVVANGIFGACSGMPTAGTVVFSRLALPSLDKNGYERSNALGAIASASVLASLIPPSVAIILCCSLADQSITRSLMCGIGGGILTMVLFILAIDFVALAWPHKIPPKSEERVAMKEKLKSLALLVPILALFAIIIIGAYTGFFTATVGGAVGAFVCMVYAMVKRCGWKNFVEYAKDAALINANFFPLLIAGVVFGRFVALSRLPDTIMAWIVAMHVNKFILFTVVLIFYIVCGCLMDMLSVLIITVPIIYPMMVAMGFDPYAMIIVLVYICSIGGITPPVGMGVFMTAASVNVESRIIFKGIVPYFIALVLSSYLVAFVPQIVTFLPNLLS